MSVTEPAESATHRSIAESLVRKSTWQDSNSDQLLRAHLHASLALTDALTRLGAALHDELRALADEQRAQTKVLQALVDSVNRCLRGGW